MLSESEIVTIGDGTRYCIAKCITEPTFKCMWSWKIGHVYLILCEWHLDVLLLVLAEAEHQVVVPATNSSNTGALVQSSAIS